MTSPTNPQPTPPAGYEILTPEVAKMKPEGMRQYVPPPFNKWVCPNLEELEALADERTYSAPIGTTALLLTPGPEAERCDCGANHHREHINYNEHDIRCPRHPRNAHVKVLPGWLAEHQPHYIDVQRALTKAWYDKLQMSHMWDGAEWEQCGSERYWGNDDDGDYAYAVKRRVYDALNRPDPIHDEVAKMDESKLQGEQGIAPLPCPFCATKAVVEYVGGGVPGMEDCGYWSCYCPRCNGSALPEPKPHAGVDGDEKDQVIRIWNTRTPPPVAGSGPTAEEMQPTVIFLTHRLRDLRSMERCAGFPPWADMEIASHERAIAALTKAK